MTGQEVKNEEILFYSVIKWLVLAGLCGIVAGGIVGLFLIVLFAGIDFVYNLPAWKYFLIPAGLLASLYSIKIFAPAAAGHGTD